MSSLSEEEVNDLCCKLKGYAKLSHKEDLVSAANQKICKNKVWKELGTRIDSSVFPKCVPKGQKHMVINPENAKTYVELCAKQMQEMKGTKGLPKGKTWEQHLCECLEPAATTGTTKTSATGNVGGMTDSSKYTGSHKERFDESGKGKGAEGRADMACNDGYVGGYKQKGTFDKKH